MWADCLYIEEAAILQILSQPSVLLLDQEPEWVAWYPTPGGAALMGDRVESIQIELLRQNRVRRNAALGPLPWRHWTPPAQARLTNGCAT